MVSVRQAVQLRDALIAKGVRVEAELHPDKGHAAMDAGFSKPARGRAPTLDETIAFLGSLSGVSPALESATSTAQTGP